jgi:SAM-dependent methyltransferase
MLENAPTELSPFERYNPKLFVGSSHTWASKWLDSAALSTRALDIGPGSGVMGELFRDRGLKDCYAVEVDQETSSKLAGLYKSIVCSVEELPDNQFELVLLLDVLEHLTNPEDMLQKVLARTTKGGIILLSVPNIAHWSIRLSLLLGYFNYTNRGILDKTHFRFFTRKTFLSMLAEFEQEIELLQYSVSIEPLELLLPKAVWNNQVFNFLSRVRVGLARLLPGLLAYQHLVAIKKR